EQQLEGRLVEPSGWIHARHVVDQCDEWERPDELLMLQEVRGIDVEVENPIAGRHSWQLRRDLLRTALAVSHEREAGAEHPTRGKLLQLRIANRLIDAADAAHRALRARDRVQGCSIVDA